MNVTRVLALTAMCCAAVLPLSARADSPGRHPYYLHALSDLRAARWMVEHRPGDAAVSGQEDVAISEIDMAIAEIKRAAIDDGKNIGDHPNVDAPPDRPGRLHKAVELLRKVYADVGREEDDPVSRDLRNRAVTHVEAALHAAEGALHAAETHR